ARLAYAVLFPVVLDRLLSVLLDPEVVADREHLLAHRVAGSLGSPVAKQSHGSSFSCGSPGSVRPDGRCGHHADGTIRYRGSGAGASSASGSSRKAAPRGIEPQTGRRPVSTSIVAHVRQSAVIGRYHRISRRLQIPSVVRSRLL